MAGPRKWHIIATGMAGLAGWLAAWHLWAERNALEAKLQESGGRSVVRNTAPVQANAGAAQSTAGGAVSLIKDRRTAELMESLTDIVAGAQRGVPNERYVQAARGVLLDNNWERRTRNMSLLLETLRAEDAPAIQEAFAALAKEGRPYEEYRYFVTRWGEVDGKGALEYMKAHPELPLSPWDKRQALKGWGQAAPEEALAWLTQNEEFSQTCQGVNSVLQGWSRQDPDAATTWLLANSKSVQQTAGSLSEIMLEQLYGKGLQGAGQWLAALPDNETVNPAKQKAWMSIQQRFYNLGSEEAGQLWSTVGSQSWVGWKDFEMLSQNVAGANRGDDSAFLAAVSRNSSPAQISDQFERWAAAEPELASGWLTRHGSDSPFRTAAINGMVRYLEKADPEAAKVWRQQLPK